MLFHGHFKMLWSVSRTYYGEVALSSPKLTMKEHFFNDSPKLSIWMLVGCQDHFRYTLRVVIAIKPMPWAKRASLYNHNRYSYCILIFWHILAQLGPILAHFVTGVGSSNLIYALTVVITFRNVLWVEVLGFYFTNWLFGPDLAQTWPKFGPICFI